MTIRAKRWRNVRRSLLLSLCSLAAVPIHAAPRIECERPRYDFGTVVGQDRIEHEFILRNTGDEPLEIVKIKDCCGVESKVAPIVIPPGSNAVCTSVFTTKNRYGEQDKQILLVTNDRKNLYFDLRMTGTLLRAVEVGPQWVKLGDLLPDTVVSETITATNLLDQAVTLDSVSTTIAGLEAKVVEAGERRWTIRLGSASSLAVGQVNGTLRLVFSTGPVEVPVVGTVKPIIQATPERIQFNPASSGEVERLVMLRSGDGRDFEVLSADLTDAEGTVEIQRLADGKWRIRLSVKPASISTGSSLVVRTSVAAQDTIVVPLSNQ